MINQSKPTNMTELVQEIGKVDKKVAEANVNAEVKQGEALIDDQKDEREDGVMPKTDSLNIATSDDNTPMRLDTVIAINSDRSIAEEKKEDDEAQVTSEQSAAEESAADQPHTESEVSAYSTQNSVEYPEGFDGFNRSSEAPEDTEDVDFVLSIRSKQSSCSTEEACMNVPKEQSDVEPTSVVTEGENLTTEEAEQKASEPEEDKSDTKSDPKSILQDESSNGEVPQDNQAKNEDCETPDDEDAVMTQPTLSDDSDRPTGEAAVTTKFTASMDSEQPTGQPMITTKSSSMTEPAVEKSPKTVSFAKGTKKDSTDDDSVADRTEACVRSASDASSNVREIFTCGCGSFFDNVEDTKEEGKADKNAIQSNVETMGAKTDSSVANEVFAPESQKVESSEKVETAQVEDSETKFEKAHDHSSADNPNDISTEMEVTTASMAVVEETLQNKVNAEPTEEIATPKSTEVAAAPSPSEDLVATEPTKEKKSPVQKEVVPALLEIVEPNVEEDDGVLLTSFSPVARRLQKAASSFDVQHGMSCVSVFSCGILNIAKAETPTAHIPMTLSQDLILEAREEAERDVETRVVLSVTPEETPEMGKQDVVEDVTSSQLMGDQEVEGEEEAKESIPEATYSEIKEDQPKDTEKKVEDHAVADNKESNAVAVDPNEEEPCEGPEEQEQNDEQSPKEVADLADISKEESQRRESGRQDEGAPAEQKEAGQSQSQEEIAVPEVQETPKASTPVPLQDTASQVALPSLPKDSAPPTPAPVEGVAEEDFERAARHAQQQAYTRCGPDTCTIL